jgi:hypothetical protein
MFSSVLRKVLVPIECYHNNIVFQSYTHKYHQLYHNDDNVHSESGVLRKSYLNVGCKYQTIHLQNESRVECIPVGTGEDEWLLSMPCLLES